MADPAVASGNRFHITAYEKRACRSDAVRYCAYAFPDETRLLTCLRRKEDLLSRHCRAVFQKGLKRRGL